MMYVHMLYIQYLLPRVDNRERHTYVFISLNIDTYTLYPYVRTYIAIIVCTYIYNVLYMYVCIYVDLYMYVYVIML